MTNRRLGTRIALQALLDQVQAHACAADQEQIDLEEDPVVDGVVASVAAAVAEERMLFLVLHAWADRVGEEVKELVVLGRAEDDRVGEERMPWEVHTVRAVAADVVAASAVGQDHELDPVDVGQGPEEAVVLAYLYLHFPAWAAAEDVNLGWPGSQALTEELDLN